LTRLFSDRTWPFQLIRYVSIGAIVFVVDVGLFRLLVGTGVFLAIAATISFGIAICVHFTFNKYVNFRAHDRPVGEQAGTYALVAFVCWLVTLAVIESGVRLFGLTPLAAKLVAVAVNLPVGFLGHRYLTFGPGIAHAIRRIFAWHARP
jgi:putative flippase GtrA